MHDPFFRYLEQTTPFSPEAKAALANALSRAELSKGTFLLEAGQVAGHIYFLETGISRSYYYDEQGREVTSWFTTEPSFTTSAYSYLSGKPSYEYIQLLSHAKVVSIPRHSLNELCRQYLDIANLTRLIAEQSYLALEERHVNTLFHDADARYEYLLATHPALFQQVPLTYIASYLGISRETLSRLRGQKK